MTLEESVRSEINCSAIKVLDVCAFRCREIEYAKWYEANFIIDSVSDVVFEQVYLRIEDLMSDCFFELSKL
jgi:hypothetical protein